MSLMKIHRSNESFWNRCGMLMLLLLLVALLMAEAANAATSTTTTTGSETQTSATNGAIRQQQQQQQKSAEEVVDTVQQQQLQLQLQHNESQTLAANSAEILSPSDVDVVAEKPTTYRPAAGNRPSIAPHNSAQERERKLMNVLAARRSALHRGGFRTRIGTTGRSATSPATAAVESTSKSPSDPRSVCIRNCTKNFTRRTTASCMRQCANFTRMAMATTNSSSSTSSSVVLRAPSKASVATGERDTNEILFSDESSHGLFVVAKEQNDTLNHIADGGAKSTAGGKQRGRGKPAIAVTIATTSVEQDDDDDEDEDELQPYLYFGAKLPPLKPGALSITAAADDNEHPRVLEVSVVQSTTTTPVPVAVESTVNPTISTRRPLTAVERSRSRYKYHMRDRGVAPTVPLAAAPPAPPVSRTRYVGSGRPNAESFLDKKQSETEAEPPPKPVVVRRLAGKPLASSTPLIITVLSAEEETTVAQAEPEMQPELITERSSTTSSTTTTKAPTSTTKKPTTTTTTSTSTSTSTTSTTTTTSTTSTTPSTTTSTSTTSTTTTTPPSTTTTGSTTTTTATAASSTAKQKTIIEEDTERLRALGPSLTQEINIEDQNNLIIFCNSTANCEATPRTHLSHTTTDSSSNSKILRTTVLTSVRSTVNPRPTTVAPRPPPVPGNVFIGIVESSSSSSAPSHISSTAIADGRDVNLEMRRMNLVTLVLVAVGLVPLVAIILYLVRNYMVRRQAKQDEVFDVCITDQQPISPVKKVDSKYQLELDDDEVDHHHHHQHQQAMPMSISQQQPQQQQQTQQSRDANHNRYDDKTSLASEFQDFERSNIRLKSLLGEGNFGQVWKAEADDLSGHFGATRIVAVKTIRACSAQVSLKDEANIMRKLGSHQNVVTLLGACVESEPHMLIMEYAMRGRLLSLLRAARSATNILPASVPGGRSLAPLSPRTLAGFALDIACGMEYIAGRRIVHRDLAARNVLLDHNGMCKICDFGMSIDLDAERMRKEQEKNAANDILRSNAAKFKFDFGSRYILQHWQHTFGQGPNGNCSKDHAHSEKKSHGHDTIGKRHALPIRWMAPESLQFHMFTTETDIWAFGIVLWEIATLGSTPYSHLTGREVIRRVPQGLRPELPKESRHEFYNLMSRCWNKEPHMRPSFAQSRLEITRSLHKWVDDDSAASDYMDVSGFSEDLEHGVVYFNHRISEFECEI